MGSGKSVLARNLIENLNRVSYSNRKLFQLKNAGIGSNHVNRMLNLKHAFLSWNSFSPKQILHVQKS